MRQISAQEKVIIPIGRQGENGAAEIIFDVSGWADLYGNGAFELLNRRPAENTPYTCSITVSDEQVHWIVQSADVALVGHGRCELTYVVDDVIAKSVVFATCVLPSIEGAGEVPEPYESRIQDLIVASAGAVIAAKDSEAYAAGTRDGADVPSDDPAYHNNSKYYSSRANSSANTAQGYASDAGTSAAMSSGSALKSEGFAVGTANGRAVASTSPYYHNNSKYYSEQASGSATAAAGSATAADGSASAAAGSATAADESATAAAGSKTAAEGSATAAAGSASAAAGSATAAARSASDAAAQLALVTAEGTRQVGLITAEGTTQKNAVIAKGQEVIESIPEDYSDLTSDVEDLKSSLSENEYYINDNLKENLDFFTVDNKYLDPENGLAYSSANYHCTDFILCKSGDAFFYRLVGTNGDGIIVKYDLSKKFASLLIGDANRTFTGILDIDEDCYIRCANRKQALPTPILYSVSSNIYKKFEENKSNAIFKTDLGTVTPYNTTFYGYGKNIYDFKAKTDGYYVSNTNGNLIAESGWSATDYIPVIGTPIFHWVYVYNAGVYQEITNSWYAFYDSDRKYLAGGIGNLKVANIPENARWLRASTETYRIEELNSGIYRKAMMYVEAMWETAPTTPNDYEPFDYTLLYGIRDFENAVKKVDYANMQDVPDYTLTEISEEVEKVRALQNDGSLSFAFLTDLHNGNSTNIRTANHNALVSLQKIERQVPLDYVVFGGDYVMNSENTPTSELDAQIRNLMQYIVQIKSPVFMLRGNHDSNFVNTSAPYSANAFFRETDKFFENGHIKMLSDDLSRCCGYVDLENLKVRLIFTNMTDSEETASGFRVSNAQIDWFGDTALDFSGKSDKNNWGVIVFAHSYFVASSITDGTLTPSAQMHGLLVAFKNGTSYTYNSKTYDFAQQGAMEVICAVVGHWHSDRSAVVNGIQVIATMQTAGGDDEPADDGNTYSKTPGTADETAYDIFTIDRKNKVIYTSRFGVGQDRQWSYEVT